MASRLYIHYGDSIGWEFENKVLIMNKLRDKSLNSSTGLDNKPATGVFWASPKHSESNWKKWCEENNFDPAEINGGKGHREGYWDKSVEFRIMKNTLATIDSQESYEYFRSRFGIGLEKFQQSLYLDFDKLRLAGYAGVEVSISKFPKLYYYLYGWDCDSVAIWNPAVIYVSKSCTRETPKSEKTPYKRNVLWSSINVTDAEKSLQQK